MQRIHKEPSRIYLASSGWGLRAASQKQSSWKHSTYNNLKAHSPQLGYNWAIPAFQSQLSKRDSFRMQFNSLFSLRTYATIGKINPQKQTPFTHPEKPNKLLVLKNWIQEAANLIIILIGLAVLILALRELTTLAVQAPVSNSLFTQTSQIVKQSMQIRARLGGNLQTHGPISNYTSGSSLKCEYSVFGDTGSGTVCCITLNGNLSTVDVFVHATRETIRVFDTHRVKSSGVSGRRGGMFDWNSSSIGSSRVGDVYRH